MQLEQLPMAVTQSRFKLWFDPWEGTVYCSVKLKGFGMVTSPKLQTRYSILLKPRCEELCGCISEPSNFIFIFKRPQRAQRSYCNHGYALGTGTALSRLWHYTDPFIHICICTWKRTQADYLNYMFTTYVGSITLVVWCYSTWALLLILYKSSRPMECITSRNDV